VAEREGKWHGTAVLESSPVAAFENERKSLSTPNQSAMTPDLVA